MHSFTSSPRVVVALKLDQAKGAAHDSGVPTDKSNSQVVTSGEHLLP